MRTSGRRARPTLETPRVVLRPVGGDDVEEIGALLAEPQVFRFLLDGAPADAVSVRALVAASEAGFAATGLGLFMARLHATSTAAGIVGFRSAEIGGVELVCALWPSLWGSGLAAEVCRACIEYAFGAAHASELLAGADAPNSASLQLIARLGFRPLRETPGAFGAIRWFILTADGAS